QLGLGVDRQIPWVALDEFGERIMHGDAELRPAGIGVELVERPETEDVAGIDRIGIAYPGLDLGDRKSTRLNSSHLVISYAVFCFTASAEIYTLSLHDALPISARSRGRPANPVGGA